MAHAYTPGLTVTPRSTHRVRRLLPIAGDVLVSVGDPVARDDVVAQALLPGDPQPVNLANIMAMPPSDVPECVLVVEGDSVCVGDPLAQTKGIFGLGRTVVNSKHAGTVETVSRVTGQLIIRGADIPVAVKAYVGGSVVEVIEGEGCVIETEAAFIQGIFGIGGETGGVVRMACQDPSEELTGEHLDADMAACVVVGGARMTGATIEKARDLGIAALVSGGMDDQDLRDFLGYDLGVAITGSENLGITLVITEGFGEITMARRTFDLLAGHDGNEASVNGATQIRAGVMRPEIIIPLADPAAIVDTDSKHVAGMLEMGRAIRVIRDPNFGRIGSVAALPPEPEALESGSRARVLVVLFENGERATIPRANVELIED